MNFDITRLKDLAEKLDYKPESQEHIDNLSNYCSSNRVIAICEGYAALEARVKELAADNAALREQRARLAREANTFEAELARLKGQEPTKAVVKHYTGCRYPVIKINSLEVVIAGDREDAEDLADYINSLHSVPAEPRPAVLPEKWEVFKQSGGVNVAVRNGTTKNHLFGIGYNQAIDDVLELGCQPQRLVVKFAPSAWKDGELERLHSADFERGYACGRADERRSNSTAIRAAGGEIEE